MLEYIYTEYGTELLLALVGAVFGALGYAAKRLADRILGEGEKRDVARTAVQYAEQACKALHGQEKLAQALSAAETLLAKRGIPFDAQEMRLLIEAALAEFNRAFQKA